MRSGWFVKQTALCALVLALGCEGNVEDSESDDAEEGELVLESRAQGGRATTLSAPTNLKSTARSQTTIDVGWSPPIKGTATRYTLYVDGASAGSVSATRFSFAKLSCSGRYTLEVEAKDASGKLSPRASLSSNTAACSTTGNDAGAAKSDAAVAAPPVAPSSPATPPVAPTPPVTTTPVTTPPVTTPPVTTTPVTTTPVTTTPVNTTPVATTPVTTTPSFTVGVCGFSQDFARIAAVGIKNVRMDRPDAATIESARGFGIEVLPIVAYGFPDLSNSSDWQLPPLPQNNAIWAKRMVDMWRTMKVPPKVFEVWNEPWGVFWKPKPDPAAYLALVKAFAAEAWAVWPRATLLVSADQGGALYPTFRTDLLAADKTGFLNDPRILPTTHNYVEGRTTTEVTSDPCAWDLNRFQCAFNDFKKHGHPNPQVWITEFGWESTTASPGYAEHATVTEQKQASETIAALELFRKSGMVAAAYSYVFQTGLSWNYNWLHPDNSDKPIVGAMKSYLLSH